jgi:Ni/Co efflux regulator RcnB
VVAIPHAFKKETCMNSRTLLSALILGTSLSYVSVPALAAEPSEESVQGDVTRNRELKVGDKAPDQFKRDDAALSDWKAKGLPAPEKESHWVKMEDHYVLVQITNGVILDIKPTQ